MSSDLEVSLAEIKGALGVIKSWGLGIALFVGSIGVASLGYVITINGQLASLKAEVNQIKSAQIPQTQEQLSEIQSSIDRLLQDREPPADESKGPMKTGPTKE